MMKFLITVQNLSSKVVLLWTADIWTRALAVEIRLS